MLEGLATLTVLAGVLFAVGLLYKNRTRVAKWLDEENLAVANTPEHRKKRLQRIIEDAQEKIDMLDEIHSEDAKEDEA